MGRNFVRTNNAFTLVELIVVIAIIGIVTAIAVPMFSNSLATAKEKADEASLRALNSATTIYRVTDTDSDPFETSEDSNYLMTVLVPDYLADAVNPQQKGKAFVWLTEEEIWVIEDDENIVTPVDAFVFFNGQIQVYDGSAGTDIVIPSEIDGTVVTSIGTRAFDHLQTYSDTWDKLTSVVLPDMLTEIKPFAFMGNSLESITIPGGVSNVGVQAFSYNKLTNVTINEGVQTIKTWAFAENELTTITIPNSVTTIDASAFRNNDITEITIGSNVDIDASAFYGTSSGFNACYGENNSEAGTYALINGEWVKSSD